MKRLSGEDSKGLEKLKKKIEATKSLTLEKRKTALNDLMQDLALENPSEQEVNLVTAALEVIQKRLNAQEEVKLQGNVSMEISRPQNMVDEFAVAVTKDLNTTLADTSKLVDEIDRKTVAVPQVKPLKLKELKAKSWKEFVTGTDGNLDQHNAHSLMNQMTNDDIIGLFGAKHLDTYLSMKKAYEAKMEELRRTNPDVRATSGKFRKMLLDLPHVINAFIVNEALAGQMWERYARKTTEHNTKLKEREKEITAKKQVSKLTGKSKRKFVGALLSKITPEEYREALQEFTDAEKGKGLHKFASITPGKMIKELERAAYANSGNKEVAKLLADPDSYKTDDVSAGYKRMMKKYQADTSKLTEAQKAADPNYTDYVQPYVVYKTDEADTINAVRNLLAQGKTKD